MQKYLGGRKQIPDNEQMIRSPESGKTDKPLPENLFSALSGGKCRRKMPEYFNPVLTAISEIVKIKAT